MIPSLAGDCRPHACRAAGRLSPGSQPCRYIAGGTPPSAAIPGRAFPGKQHPACQPEEASNHMGLPGCLVRIAGAL